MTKPKMISLNVGNTVLSSTGRQQIGGATLSSPTWARELLAMTCQLVPDGWTTAEPVLGYHEVESNDANIIPFQVLPNPLNSGGYTVAGATSISSYAKAPQKYMMGVPLNGGEEISVYGNGGFNHTTEPYAGASLVYVDELWLQKNGRLRQRHSKLGTVTVSSTTANTPVAGTKYSISNAEHIIETIGAVVMGTVAINDAVAGYLEFTSNEFDGVAKHQMNFNPIAAIVGAAGTPLIDGVTRQVCDIPLQSRSQVNIQDYGYFQLLSANECRFQTGVIYE